eukprot:scaffold12731_cov100-Isochrysis_galbana.AAC.2
MYSPLHSCVTSWGAGMLPDSPTRWCCCSAIRLLVSFRLYLALAYCFYGYGSGSLLVLALASTFVSPPHQGASRHRGSKSAL